MSSKNDNAWAGQPRKSWSMVNRLTLLYAGSAFAVLVVSGLVLYGFLKCNMRAQDQQLLADKIRILRLILRERPDDPAAYEEELEWEGAARQFNEYYARILDDRYQTLLETPGMNGRLGPELFPQPTRSDQEPGQGKTWRADTGLTYLLESAWARAGPAGPGQRLIQVALDISEEQILLARYRTTLAVVLLVATLLSTLAGRLIALKGLRPLSDITRAAQRITASQLSERIPTRCWPRELTILAREFDHMLERLEESFERLSQFSADLAHELRTPINNLMGEAEVALARSRSHEEYRQVLESGLEEYHRLSRMIESLLFLARSENAQTRIQRVICNAHQEVQAVLEYYETMAAEREVALRFHGDGRLQADPMLLRRALSNLVSNALNHTPSGGAVCVSVNSTPSLDADITISDTGCGVASEHLPRIWDRFYRADPARSRNPHGTGLGLAIVKTIMDLHGGTVRIRSQPGQGTIVTLSFPGPAKPPEPPRRPPPGTG